MLRATLFRARPAFRSIAPVARPQWRVAGAVAQHQHQYQHQLRCYADEKKLDEAVVPNPAPSTPPSDPNAAHPSTIAPSDIPKASPTTEPTASSPSTTTTTSSTSSSTTASRNAPTTPPATTPPTGTGTASVAPDPKPPKPKKRRLRKLFNRLLILSILGYGGGVYYSLVSDEFHDFFTEYIPFGEDAVAYFEEREFRKRFPGRAGTSRLYPQVTGENKVTIPSKSGLSSRVATADDSNADSAARGPHMSAVADNTKPADDAPKVASPNGAQEKKKKEASAAQDSSKDASKAEPKQEAPTSSKPIAQIDHLHVPAADEPVVQDVVKIVNDIITVINSDSTHGNKYDSALEKAKSELGKVVADINLLKSNLQKSAEEQIKSAHSEFDSAAKELVRRLEAQMHEQETRWKEEFENERERLSQTYKEKINSELEVAHKLYEQRLKNDLLEQSIALQRSFAKSVRDQVEKEREGRLGRLNELSSSVHELERLTAEWNTVVDANLKTQHLVVAVEAVKSALENQTIPKPFISELAALKEIADDDPVVGAAIASINPAAYQRGVPNAAQLIDRFRRVAQEVRKAALLPEDAGVASHIASLAMSKVLFKKSGLAVGQDVEAVLARTEILLEEGDLDSAAREMNSLQGWAKLLCKDWLSECRRVLEVKQALDVIATEARLNSLLVD